MTKNFFISIFIVFCLPISASLQKIYDVDFSDGQTLYLYSGTKTTLRINQIPRDLDSVQLSVIERPSAPKAMIIGKRLKAVNNENNSSSVEFTIDIPAISHETNIKQLIRLELKTFKKSEGQAYEIVDRYTYFIRPINCSLSSNQVCGTLTELCEEDSLACNEDSFKLQTFNNECEMRKYGADYYHDGACFDSTI
jgi:hypothetical protein